MKIIIFKDKKYIVCDSWDERVDKYTGHPDVLLIRNATDQEVDDWLRED